MYYVQTTTRLSGCSDYQNTLPNTLHYCHRQPLVKPCPDNTSPLYRPFSLYAAQTLQSIVNPIHIRNTSLLVHIEQCSVINAFRLPGILHLTWWEWQNTHFSQYIAILNPVCAVLPNVCRCSRKTNTCTNLPGISYSVPHWFSLTSYTRLFANRHSLNSQQYIQQTWPTTPQAHHCIPQPSTQISVQHEQIHCIGGRHTTLSLHFHYFWPIEKNTTQTIHCRQ